MSGSNEDMDEISKIDIIIPDEKAIEIAKRLGPEFVSLLNAGNTKNEEGEENNDNL